MTSARPGMWVGRPYVNGLVTLWLGFSLGARDGNFDRFCLWLQRDRFPAEGGHRNPLVIDAILRQAVTGETSGSLTREQDDQAVAMLSELVAEFHAAEAMS